MAPFSETLGVVVAYALALTVCLRASLEVVASHAVALTAGLWESLEVVASHASRVVAAESLALGRQQRGAVDDLVSPGLAAVDSALSHRRQHPPPLIAPLHRFETHCLL